MYSFGTNIEEENMKKKVIQFITNLNDGGAENLVREYVQLLDEDVFEVLVVTIRNNKNTAVYKQIKEYGINIKSVYPKWNYIIKIWNKILGRWYIPYKIKKIILSEKPEVIHAHLYVLKYLKKISKSLEGINLLYTCHSLPERNFAGKNKIEYDAAKYLIKHNKMRLIALHSQMALELNHMFEVNNTVVINNGIDVKKYVTILNDKQIIRKKLNLPEKAFIVGHIGRFIKLKNHDFIIDISKEIVQCRNDFFLLLIGDGELLNHVEARLKNEGLEGKYRILSNRSDVPILLKAMDTFIFPSIQEGLGIALVEAQVSGLHCVVSDTVPKEAIISKKTKVLSFEDSIEVWRDSILDVNYNSNECLKMTIDDYDMRKEIRKLEELYLKGVSN